MCAAVCCPSHLAAESDTAPPAFVAQGVALAPAELDAIGARLDALMLGQVAEAPYDRYLMMLEGPTASMTRGWKVAQGSTLSFSETFLAATGICHSSERRVHENDSIATAY